MQHRTTLLALIILVACLVALSLLGERTLHHERLAPNAKIPESFEFPGRPSGAPAHPPNAIPKSARLPILEPNARTSDGANDSDGLSRLVVSVVAKETGIPLSQVRLHVAPNTSSYSWSSTLASGSSGTLYCAPITACDGLATLTLPPNRELKLVAFHEDRAAGMAELYVGPLDEGEQRNLRIELATRRDTVFCGLIISAEDGAPIPGASITTEEVRPHLPKDGIEPSSTQWSVSPMDRTLSDDQGRFRLDLASWKKPRVVVEAEGHAKVFVEVVTGHEAPDRAFVVRLARAATLQLLMFSSSGVRAAGCSARLWAMKQDVVVSERDYPLVPGPHPEWKATTNGIGLCTFDGLPPGVPLELEALEDCSANTPSYLPVLPLLPGEFRKLEWRMGSGCLIAGTAVDQSGAPVRGVTIMMQRAPRERDGLSRSFQRADHVYSTATSDRGAFAFPNVLPGRWWIGPKLESSSEGPPGSWRVVPLEVVEAIAGEKRIDVLLKVYQGLFIRGRVVGPHREPIAGADVIARNPGLIATVRTRADEDGVYVLSLPTAGPYELKASKMGFVESAIVEADPGDSGVQLELKTECRLRGRVVDGQTGAGCRARIAVSRGDGTFRLAESLNDGRFEVRGIEPGAWDLSAFATGGRVGLIRGANCSDLANAPDAVLVLNDGGVLRVVFEGAENDSAFCRVLQNDVLRSTLSLRGGESDEVAVPTGNVVVECALSDGASRFSLEVVKGKVGEVVVGR